MINALSLTRIAYPFGKNIVKFIDTATSLARTLFMKFTSHVIHTSTKYLLTFSTCLSTDFKIISCHFLLLNIIISTRTLDVLKQSFVDTQANQNWHFGLYYYLFIACNIPSPHDIMLLLLTSVMYSTVVVVLILQCVGKHLHIYILSFCKKIRQFLIHQFRLFSKFFAPKISDEISLVRSKCCTDFNI